MRSTQFLLLVIAALSALLFVTAMPVAEPPTRVKRQGPSAVRKRQGPSAVPPTKRDVDFDYKEELEAMLGKNCHYGCPSGFKYYDMPTKFEDVELTFSTAKCYYEAMNSFGPEYFHCTYDIRTGEGLDNDSGACPLAATANVCEGQENSAAAVAFVKQV